MSPVEVPDALYDEAKLWLSQGERVEVCVGGAWIEVTIMQLDPNDSIVKGYTPESLAIWFALTELAAIREVPG